MTDDSDTLITTIRHGLDEDEAVARATTDAEVEEQLSWAEVRVGEAQTHIERHTPTRALHDIAVDRELLREYEQLLRAHTQHKTAAAELAADIKHENETGKWEGVGDPGTRQRALRREADYLPAMLHVLERWAKGKAAAYAAREEDQRP